MKKMWRCALGGVVLFVAGLGPLTKSMTGITEGPVAGPISPSGLLLTDWLCWDVGKPGNPRCSSPRDEVRGVVLRS